MSKDYYCPEGYLCKTIQEYTEKWMAPGDFVATMLGPGYFVHGIDPSYTFAKSSMGYIGSVVTMPKQTVIYMYKTYCKDGD